MLSVRERSVMERRRPLDGTKGETLAAIGETWGVCRERIRQIEQRAIRKIWVEWCLMVPPDPRRARRG